MVHVNWSLCETAPHVIPDGYSKFHLLLASVYHGDSHVRRASVWCRVSHRAALGTDPRTPIDSLGEAGRTGIEPRAILEFNRRAANVKKICFALKIARSRRRPTPRANPRVSISSARRRLAMRSIVREFTAPASPVRRGWFIRESASPKVASPSLTKVTHFFVTASHAARTSSGGATTPKSFSKCS